MYKIIKTEKQYEEYLELAEELIDLNPEPGSDAGNKLEQIALLITNYEDIHYPIDLPETEMEMETEQE